MAVLNLGRQINFISGIQGVNSGGQANVNLGVNMRLHANVFTCAAINYTGGTGLATTKITGAGANNLTVTPTVVNGVITAVAVVAGGTGYVTGDTVTITDATGTGFVGTVTAGGGVVSAVAITSTGSASPINPGTMITSIKQLVNGVIIRDISPAQIIQIAQANGYYPGLGELPLFYTEPNLNQLVNSEATSWDLAGQSTLQIQFAISGLVTSPNITGWQEFDYFRNTTTDGKGGKIPSLQPVAQHSFSWNVNAGRNTLNNLPINYPIRRLWFTGSTAGQISQLEIYQDKNKIAESTVGSLYSGQPVGLSMNSQAYSRYGFNMGRPNYINQTWGTIATTDKTVQRNFNAPSAFDAAYLSDPDGRFWKALRCQSELLIVAQSAVQQTITIVMETLPGAYRA